MDKEPHRREPPEYAPPGQEYAPPGREYAKTGLEQQGERTQATDYASPRQEKNRGEREKLLRTMLLGTATVAVAAAVVSVPMPQTEEWDDHWIVTNIVREDESVDYPKIYGEYRWKAIRERSPAGYSDGFPFEGAMLYSSLEETVIEDMNYIKETSGDDAYCYDAENNIMYLPRPCVFSFYVADAPGEPLSSGAREPWHDPNIWRARYLDPSLVARGATIVVRVDYPLGNDYYRDEYQYNLATGEFTQTMDGQWTMQFDKYYDSKPVSEVHQSTAAESK